jgi:hypothetical protein
MRALVLVAVTAAVLATGAASRELALPGLMTSAGPWPANNGPSLGPRLKQIGIAKLKEEGQRLHTHQHLDIVVDGQGYRIPSGIGIDKRDRFLSPLHTHDFSGITHIESPVIRTFTLGQLFDVWGLRFNSKCLGAYCATGKKKVWVFVNGKSVLGDPRALALKEHQEIVVAYGTYPSIPKPIPWFFPFPEGL